MTTITEGAKPHLTLVPQAFAEEPQAYADKLTVIIQTLTARKLRKERIDAAEAIGQLDAEEDNGAVRDWLADNGILSKAAFDRLFRRIMRDKRVREALGFASDDPVDFVRQYAASKNITLTPRGTINRARTYAVGDGTIDQFNKDTSAETRLIYDVVNATGDNIDSLARELRLVVERFNLGWRDSIIGDALQTWQEEINTATAVNALSSIQYARGRATGPEGIEMWNAMERACFDVSSTRAGFSVAVIKKFMWQVKRKARNLDVTNHLMPVLTGAQGRGKSEFVKAMTAPLRDMMRAVDFNALTDGKTTDIWSAWILFIDEMGFFKKADVDQVKNLITATDHNIRTMRSNHSAVVRNAATLIGASNTSLATLIRDDTGGRRFAELAWSNAPDWDASNAIDWTLLWQSVDEMGPDPMIDADMMSELRSQQEANRNQLPVEVWAREFAHVYKDWSRASDIHLVYREWEKDAFPRDVTSQTMFGKQMTQMIATMPDFPMEKSQDRRGVTYRYRIVGGAA